MQPATDDAFLDALMGEDVLGAVVRAHIHIEARLSELLVTLTPFPEHLPKNLRFEQKARLAVALGLVDGALVPLIQLGNIRNAFAHRIDADLTENMVNDLYLAFAEEDRAVLANAYENTHAELRTENPAPYAKLDPRGKFITLAVAMDKFLIGAQTEAAASAAI